MSEELARLEQYLKTLGSASRLELVARLRTPRTLDEISSPPVRRSG